MQLKAMQLKVSMQNNIGGKRINKGYICSLSSTLVFFTYFFLLIREKILSCKQSLILVSKRKKLLSYLGKILSCKQSLILVSKRKKLLSYLGESFLVIFISYLTHCIMIHII